jgi:SAM-dependent methyltransferase
VVVAARTWIDDLSRNRDALASIASVGHFQDSQYRNLDIVLTLDYERIRYIDPIRAHIDVTGQTLFDCGAGYGWLSFAYLLSGGGRAILCDIDCRRLAAASEIATILGLHERCRFICKPMQDLSLEEDSVDVFASVETLEHVGDSHVDRCIDLIAAATRKLVVLTTPNKLFPVVVHDTRIPFAHWLPQEHRKRYVQLFGRVDRSSNDFVSPWRLGPIRRKFRPVSAVLTFPTYRSWEASYPFQSPYGTGDRWRDRPPVWLKATYRLTALLLKQHAYIFSPNLCRIWLRKGQPPR